MHRVILRLVGSLSLMDVIPLPAVIGVDFEFAKFIIARIDGDSCAVESGDRETDCQTVGIARIVGPADILAVRSEGNSLLVGGFALQKLLIVGLSEQGAVRTAVLLSFIAIIRSPRSFMIAAIRPPLGHIGMLGNGNRRCRGNVQQR